MKRMFPMILLFALLLCVPVRAACDGIVIRECAGVDGLHG